MIGVEEQKELQSKLRKRISDEISWIEERVREVMDTRKEQEFRFLFEDIRQNLRYLVHLAVTLGWLSGKLNPRPSLDLYLSFKDFMLQENARSIDLSGENLKVKAADICNKTKEEADDE